MSKSIIIPQKQYHATEECGIIGMRSDKYESLSEELYFGLFALQHRGQESAGIAVQHEPRKIYYYKKMGLVSEVFDEDNIRLFPAANCGIGHVRYSTTGSSNVLNAQPVVFYGRFGRMAIAHNGNIVNCDMLKSRLIKEGHVFQSSIDSEVIATLINKHSGEGLIEGIKKACLELIGAFSLVIMADDKLIAVRDKFGLHPLIMGKKEGKIVFASESCCLDALGAEIVRDVLPGEMVIASDDGITSEFFTDKPTPNHCIFEYVYIARSDSCIDQRMVYGARYDCGKYLAELYNIDADIVAGVPDSAIMAARGYSEATGIKQVDALSKNRYVGRTFIQPSQALRENGVRIKLNAIKSNINGKRLILIDDSIVRGTTSRKIIKLLRDNGAKEVHMLIASPIVTSPCFFGVDMESSDTLIGGHMDEEAICKSIGADSLHYLPMEYLVKACGKRKEDFCTACFDAKYPIDVEEFNCGKFVLEL